MRHTDNRSHRLTAILASMVTLVGAQYGNCQVRAASNLRPANGRLTAEFSSIASVRELADGRLLIVDEKENRITVADFKSGATSVLGRIGSGPGEYTQVARIWSLSADSSLLKEPFGLRWLLFDGAQITQTLGAGHPIVAAFGSGRILGTDGDCILIAVEILSHCSHINGNELRYFFRNPACSKTNFLVIAYYKL